MLIFNGVENKEQRKNEQLCSWKSMEQSQACNDHLFVPTVAGAVQHVSLWVTLQKVHERVCG